jgi:hypothetical protein
MQQKPTRERIIRPTEQDRINMGQDRKSPTAQLQEEYDETTQEELSPEDLLEWLTQKAINLENRIWKLEMSRGIKTSAPIPPNIPQKQKPKQPYEEVYTQEAPEGTPKKKKQSAGRLIALFVAIILVIILIINIIGVVFYGYSLPF